MAMWGVSGGAGAGQGVYSLPEEAHPHCGTATPLIGVG